MGPLTFGSSLLKLFRFFIFVFQLFLINFIFNFLTIFCFHQAPLPKLRQKTLMKETKRVKFVDPTAPDSDQVRC